MERRSLRPAAGVLAAASGLPAAQQRAQVLHRIATTHRHLMMNPFFCNALIRLQMLH